MGTMKRRSDSTSEETERGRSRRRLTRWQAEFPYHWDADDLVSRRELLRFTVMASGALFAATAGVVGLSYLNKLRSVRKQAVAQTTDIPPGGVRYFQYPTTEDEAILLHLPDGRFVAYSGRCTHLSCAVYYDQARGTLVCPCHEGVFDPQTVRLLLVHHSALCQKLCFIRKAAPCTRWRRCHNEW